MTRKERNFVLRCLHENAFDIMLATDAAGLGMDTRCWRVAEIGASADIPTYIQRTGRARLTDRLCRTLVIVSVPVIIQTYKLYLRDARAVRSFNEAILHFLDTSSCRQVASNLWPSNICVEEPVCKHRCDNCEHHFDIYDKINLMTCASTLVGSGYPDDSGIIGELHSHGKRQSLKNIVNAWEAHVHFKSDNGDGIAHDLRQFIILRLCAMDFFTPVLETHPSGSRVYLHASEPRLLSCLYSLHSAKPMATFKKPE